MGRGWRRRVVAPVAGVAAALLAIAPARAEEWLRADSAHLEVYSNAGRTAVEGFARKIETYDAFLHALLGVPAGAKQDRLHVYLVASDADMKTLWPVAGIAGFYDGSGDEPMLVVRYNRVRQAITRGETSSDADDTAFHEYTHYFQYAHFPSSYPGWVIEGYAQYLGTIRFEDDAMVLGHSSSTLVQRVKAGWLPWEEVLRGTTGKIPRDKWSAFYGQSWLLTHYLSSDPTRAAAFNRYLVKVAGGGDPVTSLTEALGVDLPTLGHQLERYYRSPLQVQRIQWHPSAPPAVTVASLPAPEAALILPDARTRYFIREGDRAGAVETVRGIAAHYPGDRFALLAAARVDAKYGDAARAEATLAPLLATDPKDADALLLRGRARLRRAAAADTDVAKRASLQHDARADLDTAMGVRPDAADILYHDALARKTDPAATPRQAIAILAHALDIRPQSETIRLALGETLLKAKRRADARIVLQSLLNSPHDGESKRAAEKLFETYPDVQVGTTGSAAAKDIM